MSFATDEQKNVARQRCEAQIQTLLHADIALCRATQHGGHTYQSKQLIKDESKNAGRALTSLKTTLKNAFTEQGIEANQAAGWASDLATHIQSEIQMQAVKTVAGKHDSTLHKAAFQSNMHLSA